MTQLGEKIAFGTPSDWECPFDHKKQDVKPRNNVMPKWEKNDADTLGTNLGDEYHFNETLSIRVAGKAHEAQYTPHHLIPGNASWPKTKLQKWVDKRHADGWIKENIGYDVNAQYNGVSLPGNAAARGHPGGWTAYPHQEAYAIACMEASLETRQFHDAHPAYNEFVAKVLDKVEEKLRARIDKTEYPGCGKKDCAGRKRKKKPYDPPYGLLDRLENIALRLERYLVGGPRGWRMPIYTSRFALMYQMKITEKDAQKKLKAAQADPGQF